MLCVRAGIARVSVGFVWLVSLVFHWWGMGCLNSATGGLLNDLAGLPLTVIGAGGLAVFHYGMLGNGGAGSIWVQSPGEWVPSYNTHLALRKIEGQNDRLIIPVSLCGKRGGKVRV